MLLGVHRPLKVIWKSNSSTVKLFNSQLFNSQTLQQSNTSTVKYFNSQTLQQSDTSTVDTSTVKHFNSQEALIFDTDINPSLLHTLIIVNFNYLCLDLCTNRCGVEHSPLFGIKGTQSHIVTWGSQTPESNMERSPGLCEGGYSDP